MSKEWTTNFEGEHLNSLMIKMFAAMLSALIVLAVFQSAALVTWSYDLPISAYSETISSAAEQWHALMENMGFAELSETISEAIQSLHDDWPISD